MRMTTPKELAEEFRKLAAATEKISNEAKDPLLKAYFMGRATAFDDAAQMVEERLNG